MENSRFLIARILFSAGDGSTTFNIPDMREAVPVGVGTRPSGVTNHDTYTLGQFKDDQLQRFLAKLYTSDGSYPYPLSSGSYSSQTSAISVPVNGRRGSTDYLVDVMGSTAIGDNGGNISTRHGKSTRTKQIGLNFIIKF